MLDEKGRILSVAPRERLDAHRLVEDFMSAANVAAAVRATGAPGVDVSSGVEASRGVKDPARIAAFIAAEHARWAPLIRSAGIRTE